MILAMVFSFSSSERVPFATIRSRFEAIVAIPLSSDFSETSINLTLNPLCAKVWAIPLPMVPAPITAMFFIYYKVILWNTNVSDDNLFIKAIDNLVSDAKCFSSMFECYYWRRIVCNGIGKSFELIKNSIILFHFRIRKIDLFFNAFRVLQNHIEITRNFRRILHLDDFAFLFKEINRDVRIFLEEPRFTHIFEGNSARSQIGNAAIFKFESCIGNIGRVADHRNAA